MRDHGLEARLEIRVRKGVPGGGGLGSSVASAAAAVTAANRLFDLGLSRGALVPYAAHGETAAAGAAHADNVAAALFGGFVIVDLQSPTSVRRVRPGASLRFAIAAPRISLTTAAARRALPQRLSIAEHSHGCARAALIAVAMAEGDIAGVGRALEGSFSDRARSKLIPGFPDVCRSARSAGAAGATLSGAGPSVMAVVDAARAQPRRVAEAMREAFRRAGVEADTYVAAAAGPARVIEAR